MKQNHLAPGNPPLAQQWVTLGIKSKDFTRRRRWLAEPRNLNSSCVTHFRLATELFKLSRRNYDFAGTAFLEAIIGLERAMRLHFKSPEESYGTGSNGSGDAFGNLFERTVKSGLLTDGIFRSPTQFKHDLLDRSKPVPTSHAEALSQIVPTIRNKYVHGKPIVLREFFALAIDLRVIADQLTTRPTDPAISSSHHLLDRTRTPKTKKLEKRSYHAFIRG